MIYIFWTCRNELEAKKIVWELLNQKWIACASILPSIQSIYRWEGKIEESQEIKVILKTVAPHFETIQNYILKSCSYAVPEIVAVNVTHVNPSYLFWVEEETNTSSDHS